MYLHLDSMGRQLTVGHLVRNPSRFIEPEGHYSSYKKTSQSRVFQQLTVAQLIKKFLVFYGNGRFITAFTSSRH
jgi:hypothetical protein